MAVQAKRLLRAALILGIAFVVLGATAAAEQRETAAAAQPFSGEAFARSLVDGEEAAAENSIAALDAAVGREAREVPAWVSEEVLSLDGATEIRALDDWSLIGFTLPGEAEAVQAQVAAELEGRGWALVETGAGASLSGVKKGGRCSWLLLNCTAVGDETCIVVQLPAV